MPRAAAGVSYIPLLEENVEAMVEFSSDSASEAAAAAAVEFMVDANETVDVASHSPCDSDMAITGSSASVSNTPRREYAQEHGREVCPVVRVGRSRRTVNCSESRLPATLRTRHGMVATVQNRKI